MSPPIPHKPAPASAPLARWLIGLKRGFARRCPVCGEGALLEGYVKPRAECPACAADLRLYRADDAPAYFTILIVGHIVIPAMLTVEMTYHPPVGVHWMLWIPLTILLSFLLLPRVKGALIGLQWAHEIKG